jgi:PTS system ascorbate-specific IIB component
MKEIYIATICGHGLGTALVMKMTLFDVLEENGIPSRIEVADFGTGFMLPVDFFVVTPEMEDKAKATGKPYALVVNVANKDDYRENVVPKLRELFGD